MRDYCMLSIHKYFLGSCLVPETVKELTVEKGGNVSRFLDAWDWLPLGKIENNDETKKQELQVTTGAVGKIKQAPLKG